MRRLTGEREILAALNAAQREAVLHEKGPLLILAGAGSGKTRAVTHRIAHLIHRGHAADNILAITFTNKAAGEMKERVMALCGLETRWISTFHSFAARLLRQHIHKLEPYDNSFSIYDADDCRALLKEVLKDLMIEPSLWRPRAAQAEISRIKNSALENIDDLFGAQYVYGQVLRGIHRLYQERLRERNAVDFDDLLLLTVRLFQEHADILQRCREQFTQVLVDEYQDTNAIQYQITRLLSAEHRNICITGDPDQSIYRWRGADIRNILNFEKDYPDAGIVRLDQNYRSTKNILHIANALIAHNEFRKPKDLWTENPTGEPVRVYRFGDEREEARETVLLMDALLKEGMRPGEIALFYRINSMSRPVEEELIHANIPYTIVGGVEFFLRKEVKDILAYLQLVDNPRDAASLRRIINVPPRNIGKSTWDNLAAEAQARGVSILEVCGRGMDAAGLSKRALAGLKRFTKLFRELAAKKDGPITALLSAVVELTDYKRYLIRSYGETAADRLANLGELINAGEEYERNHAAGLRGFLENARLLGDVDRWQGSADRVTLMTLHSAKGLEFPVVVIAGVEDGILPLLRADDPDSDIEEERRLLYVGITRARRKLYITHAARRLRFGQSRRAYPSRFLQELEPKLPRGEELQAVELDPETQASLSRGECEAVLLKEDFYEDDPGAESWDLDENPYPLGTRVRHEVYGEGEVVRSSGFGRLRRVTVAFEEAGTKQFVAEYAPLRRVP